VAIESKEVFAHWKSVGSGIPEWKKLSMHSYIPQDTKWVQTMVKPEMANHLWTVCSGDLLPAFGAYRIADMWKSIPVGYEDIYTHWSRICDYRKLLKNGSRPPCIVAVKDSRYNTVVIADGVHRVLAASLENKISDIEMYLGTHESMANSVDWGSCAWANASLQLKGQTHDM